MTDDALALRRSPLGDVVLDVRGTALTITEEPFRQLVDVRGTTQAPAAGEHVWRLGPDWWLVDDAPTDVVGLEVPLTAQVRTAVPATTSVVDVSSHRTTFVLTGADALEVLRHGCSIDLERVPVGGCVQGVLAQTQVAIGRTDEGWRLHPRSSFARHLATWLVDASVELVDPWPPASGG